MILIADSSALITLSICNCINLLDEIFGVVKVPSAVYKEVTREFKPESKNLSEFLDGKIEEINIEDYIIVEGVLGIGELEAMALYKKLNADWLLVDDEKARKVARINRIQVIGSLGVLLLAKQKKKIATILPLIQTIQKSNIYYSDKLINKILKLADEN